MDGTIVDIGVVASLDVSYIKPLCCNIFLISFRQICLQCFDAVGWAAGRASGLLKN